MCLLTKFEGGLQSFHDVEDDTLDWLETAVFANYSYLSHSYSI